MYFSLCYVLFCLAIYFLQEKMIFQGESLPADYPFEFEDKFIERYFNVEQGVELHALHFKVENPKGVILYFHGNAGSLRSWGGVYKNYLKYGHDFLIYDYRGYGKSMGTIHSENQLFKDAQFIYDDVKNEYTEDKVILISRSLGSGIASYLANKNNPKMLVLETPYSSLTSVAKHHYPFLPGFMLKYPLKTIDYLQDVSCPVFLIHGTEDEVIPFQESEKLKGLLKSEQNFFIISQSHHNDLDTFPEYTQALDKIFNN